jgi:hypothetical protein
MGTEKREVCGEHRAAMDKPESSTCSHQVAGWGYSKGTLFHFYELLNVK